MKNEEKYVFFSKNIFEKNGKNYEVITIKYSWSEKIKRFTFANTKVIEVREGGFEPMFDMIHYEPDIGEAELLANHRLAYMKAKVGEKEDATEERKS